MRKRTGAFFYEALTANQQPQPQSLPQPLLKPPQRRRIIIRITIQEEPPQPLLQPQPINEPPFAFLNHTMKSKRKCYKSQIKLQFRRRQKYPDRLYTYFQQGKGLFLQPLAAFRAFQGAPPLQAEFYQSRNSYECL